MIVVDMMAVDGSGEVGLKRSWRHRQEVSCGLIAAVEVADAYRRRDDHRCMMAASSHGEVNLGAVGGAGGAWQTSIAGNGDLFDHRYSRGGSPARRSRLSLPGGYRVRRFTI
jgi:hypothetical protein